MTVTVRISHPPPKGVPHAPDVVFRFPMDGGDWARDVSKTGKVSLQPKVFTRTWEKFAGEIKNHGVTGYLALRTLEEQIDHRLEIHNKATEKVRKKLESMKAEAGLDPAMQLFPRDATIWSGAPQRWHDELEKQKAVPDDVWEELEKQNEQHEQHVDAAYWVAFRGDVLRAVLFRYEITGNVDSPALKEVEKAIADAKNKGGRPPHYSAEELLPKIAEVRAKRGERVSINRMAKDLQEDYEMTKYSDLTAFERRISQVLEESEDAGANAND